MQKTINKKERGVFLNKKVRKLIFITTLMLLFIHTTEVMASNLGVNGHYGVGDWSFAGHTKELKSKYLREVLYWEVCDQNNGKGCNIPEQFSRILNQMYTNGTKPIIVLGYGNRYYDWSDSNVKMPDAEATTGEAKEYLDAFMNYVSTVATAHKDVDGVVYEVWNEPEMTAFNPNFNTDGRKYGLLFNKVYDAIITADPDATVLAYALAGNGSSGKTFVRNAYSVMNLNSKANAKVSVHCYGQFTYYSENRIPESDIPGTGATDGSLWRLKQFNDIFTGIGYTGDIWITEAGRYTGTANVALTEQEQAAYTIREAVLADDVMKSANRNSEHIRYCLVDPGTNPASSEHNYGLVTQANVKKEAFYAVKTFNTLLSDKKLDNLDVNSGKYLANYKNTTTGEDVYVAWSINGNSTDTITVPLSNDIACVYNYKGELLEKVHSSDGSIVLSVDGNPKFVECRKTRPVDVIVSVNGNLVTVLAYMDLVDENAKSTIIVVPENITDLKSITPANVAYIGETIAVDEVFTHRFTMPLGSEGKYKLLLKLANSEVKNQNLDTGTAPNFASAGEFTISGNTSVTATAKISNISNVVKTASIVIAQYDSDGKLLSVTPQNYEIPINTVWQDYSCTIGKLDNAATVSAFLFDSLTGIRPLANKVDLN